MIWSSVVVMLQAKKINLAVMSCKKGNFNPFFTFLCLSVISFIIAGSGTTGRNLGRAQMLLLCQN